jgi:hypothetical protein
MASQPQAVDVKSSKNYMPKQAQDLRLRGIKFEDALKRIISAPPMPEKTAKKEAKKALKKLRRN